MKLLYLLFLVTIFRQVFPRTEEKIILQKGLIKDSILIKKISIDRMLLQGYDSIENQILDSVEYVFSSGKQILDFKCSTIDGIAYYQNGNLYLIQMSYINGMLERIIYFYPNGNIMKISNYYDAVLTGNQMEYYPNGIKKTEVCYPFDRNDSTLFKLFKNCTYCADSTLTSKYFEVISMDSKRIYGQYFEMKFEWYENGVMKTGYKKLTKDGEAIYQMTNYNMKGQIISILDIDKDFNRKREMLFNELGLIELEKFYKDNKIIRVISKE